MKKWTLFLTLSVLVWGTPILFSDDREVMDKDIQELEALIEGKAPVQQREPTAAKKPIESEKDYYKSFGDNMSIRGDGKYLYIKAGPTSIVIDAKGRIHIKSVENIFMQSKKSIFLQAEENINLIAGGEVLKSKLTKRDVSSSPAPKPSTEWFNKQEPTTTEKEGIVEEDVAAPAPAIVKDEPLTQSNE